jgi:uncharacterized phage-associated protein
MQNTQQIQKIGSALNLMSQKLGPTYLTKALKLLYILDETSVKETGVPVTWLEYKVWKMGPVPFQLYSRLKNNISLDFLPPNELDNFIQVIDVPNPVQPGGISKEIRPVGEFVDDVFSDYEVELLEAVIKDYGHLTATELINKLHEEGTLWHKIVKDESLDREFALQSNTSNHTIPFTDLIGDDPLKELAYRSAYEANQFYSEL